MLNLTVVEISTIILSIIATIISLCSVVINKRQLVNTTITNNRIKWINSVRELTHEFLREYLKRENSDQYKKECIYVKICLFLRNDVEIYQKFLDLIKKCTYEKFEDNMTIELVIETQILLNSVWNRMKREAGISNKSELKLANQLMKEKLKNVQL